MMQSDASFVPESSSFRDTSNVIIHHQQELFRLIFHSGADNFLKAEKSGLIASLQEKGWLINHTHVDVGTMALPAALKEKTAIVIKPEIIPFISYPYEWSFSQLKDAAILTLEILLHSLEKGFVLKDASAYNIQFRGAQAVFIDSHSFEPYEPGKPWTAYKQFCQHFLGPLLAHKYTRPDAAQNLSLFIDGPELALISSLLPYKTKFNPYILTHIHWHAKMEGRYQRDKEKTLSLIEKKISLKNLTGFINYLLNGIQSLETKKDTGVWGDYYSTTQNYSEQELAIKKQAIAKWAEHSKPNLAFDMGCNTGFYSDVIADYAKQTIAADIEHDCINAYYRKLKKDKIKNILPLNIDLSNPSPAIGWSNEERMSFTQRFKSDFTIGLALMHHLCLGNNISLPQLRDWFASGTTRLALEFVPKSDPQAQRLLVTKKDVFTDYNFDTFITIFSKKFRLENKVDVTDSGRILCFFERI